MSLTGPRVEIPPESPFMAPPEALPNYDLLVTEDDTPVDGIYSERLMRLLVQSLYASWPGPGPGRSFMALANVGLFYAVAKPPLVPDVLLALDVLPPDNPHPKPNRSYFIWKYGKPPELVIEIVSNKEGDELTRKLKLYAEIGVTYYVVWDPEKLLGDQTLQCFVLSQKSYVSTGPWFPAVGLGVKLVTGTFEGISAEWLRWCDANGKVLQTAEEHAEAERRRADALAAQLRALGVEPQA